MGDLKRVASRDEPWELFNLREERTESNNLANSYPDKVSEPEEQWTSMLAETGEVAPVKGYDKKE